MEQVGNRDRIYSITLMEEHTNILVVKMERMFQHSKLPTDVMLFQEIVIVQILEFFFIELGI